MVGAPEVAPGFGLGGQSDKRSERRRWEKLGCHWRDRKAALLTLSVSSLSIFRGWMVVRPLHLDNITEVPLWIRGGCMSWVGLDSGFMDPGSGLDVNLRPQFDLSWF